MSTSDMIAMLALAISLISFWLSYRAARLTKLVAAAEKRTQVHSILVGVLLEAGELLSLVRVGTTYKGTDVTLPKDLSTIETQLTTMVELIPERLAWLREKSSNDPVILEEYKAYALEVESRVKQVAPMIREIRVLVKERQ